MLFDELGHKYDGYQSVSEFLERFKKPFPKDLIAGKMAAKGEMTKEEILYKWDLNSKISCDYGKSCHGAIEYFIKFGEKPKLHTKLVAEFAKKYDRKELISEIIAYNDTIKVAGTLDIIRKLGNKEVDIIDLKTNAEMTNEKLDDYALQLSMYKWLLEQKGLRVRNLILEHWTNKLKTIIIKPNIIWLNQQFSQMDSDS